MGLIDVEILRLPMQFLQVRSNNGREKNIPAIGQRGLADGGDPGMRIRARLEGSLAKGRKRSSRMNGSIRNLMDSSIEFSTMSSHATMTRAVPAPGTLRAIFQQRMLSLHTTTAAHTQSSPRNTTTALLFRGDAGGRLSRLAKPTNWRTQALVWHQSKLHKDVKGWLLSARVGVRVYHLSTCICTLSVQQLFLFKLAVCAHSFLTRVA